MPDGALRWVDFDKAIIVLLGAGGFFAAVCLVINGDCHKLALKLDDPVQPHVLLWLLLIGMQGALWLGSLAVVVPWYKELRVVGRPSRLDIGLGLVLPLGLITVAGFLLGADQVASVWPPATLGDVTIVNLPILGDLGLVAAFPAVAGLFLVGIHARKGLPQFEERSERLRQYLLLHRLMDAFLLLLAVILGLGVLATAALRVAYNAQPGVPDFAKEYVIAYGGYFSVFISVAYAAARVGLLAQGRELRDSMIGAPPSETAGFIEWHASLEALSSLLRLKLTGLKAFGETFSVLAPLLLGTVSAYLGS